PLLAMTSEPPATAVADNEATRASQMFSPAALIDLARARLFERRFVVLVTQFVVADGLIRVGGNLIIPYMNVYFVRHLGSPDAVFGALRFAERALVVVATLLVALPVTRFGPVATIVVTQLL